MRITAAFIWRYFPYYDNNTRYWLTSRTMIIEASRVAEWWDQVYSLCPLEARCVDIDVPGFRRHLWLPLRPYDNLNHFSRRALDATWNDMLQAQDQRGSVRVEVLMYSNLVPTWDRNSNDSTQPSNHAFENWAHFLPRRD